MSLWMVFVIVGIVFLMLEMLVPTMFFLNLAVAGFLTAVVALFVNNLSYLILIFAALSILSILFLRPIFMRHKTSKENETGIEDKYIGKIVKVTEPINKSSGAITIYDERWEARCDTQEPISVGSEVKIIKFEGLILTVERI